MKTDIDSLRVGEWFIHKYENHQKFNGPFLVLGIMWSPDEGKVVQCMGLDGRKVMVTVGSEPMWGDLELYTIILPKFDEGDGIAIMIHTNEKAAHIILAKKGTVDTYQSCIISFDTDKYLVPLSYVATLDPEIKEQLDRRN